MTSKFTKLMLVALALVASACSKDEFSERDAIAAQKELLNLKYQHELDLEALKQKGATAMQQLINTAALEQLKFNDSLTRESAIALAKKDYSVSVIDVVTNAPVEEADVIVSSEGKLFTVKTNKQGIAMFNSLYLFPTSTFLISKAGYAASHVLAQNITNGPAKLWNSADLTNEISGTLFIDTDLTNDVPEKVGADVLVSASTLVFNGFNDQYSVSFPTYTKEDGSYSLKLPIAPNGFTFSFGRITAEQKLFVNGFGNGASTAADSLPFLTTITTHFNVNNFNAAVPLINTPLYLRFPKDRTGDSIVIPVTYGNGNNQILLSLQNGYFQVEQVNVPYYFFSRGNFVNLGNFTFESNISLDVELIDITGNIVKTAPLLAARTNDTGKLIYGEYREGGRGYVFLKRDESGSILPNAKGMISKALPYESFYNSYSLNFDKPLNTVTNSYEYPNILQVNKGDKKVLNFYYGSGDTRDKVIF